MRTIMRVEQIEQNRYATDQYMTATILYRGVVVAEGRPAVFAFARFPYSELPSADQIDTPIMQSVETAPAVWDASCGRWRVPF